MRTEEPETRRRTEEKRREEQVGLKERSNTKADCITLTWVPPRARGRGRDGDKSPGVFASLRDEAKRRGRRLTSGRRNTSARNRRVSMWDEDLGPFSTRKKNKKRRDGGFVAFCINLPDYSGFMTVPHPAASSPLLTRSFPSSSDL